MRVLRPWPGNSRLVADVLRDLNAGDVISSRYRLEKRLGAGATAAVWQARDRDLGRLVALKMLLGSEEVVPELATRFEREATILGRLSHPNLVPVLATGNHEGRPYLVMELVDGESLQQVLRRGPMDVDDAVELVAEIASGLGAAHVAGVVHRDIKPANILCTASGSPRLVDFGIARVDDLTSITGTNFVIGTASYLSPEQARGASLDPASDVYSLGCVLFEALTGQPPFDGETAVAVAYRHVHDEPPSPRTLRPDIPAHVAAVVERCLAKEPAERYRNGTELEHALRLPATDPLIDTGATTVIAPVRDQTMVIPPVAFADDGDVADVAGTGTPDRRWIFVAALAAATIVLLIVLALSLAADHDSNTTGRTTDSSVQSTSLTTTTTVPTTIAPPPKPEKGHGRKGHD